MATAALLAMVLLLLAPAALAQSPQGGQRMDVILDRFVDDPSLPNNRIAPETGVAKVAVNALLNVNMYRRTAACSTPVQVDFSVQGPGYATAAMVPATRSVLVEGSSANTYQAAWNTFPVATTLEIAVGRDAPAFEYGLYEITMRASSPPNPSSPECELGTSSTVTATYRLKNDFAPRIAVSVPDLFKKAGPNEKIVFPVTVSNLGNGPTRVTLRLEPSDPDVFAAFNGGPDVRLEAQGRGHDGQDNATFLVSVTTASTWGYTNSFSSLKATVTATYDGVAPGNTYQEETAVVLTVQSQGFYASLWGLSSGFTIGGALVGAALLGAFAGISVVALWRRMRPRREPGVERAAPKANSAPDVFAAGPTAFARPRGAVDAAPKAPRVQEQTEGQRLFRT